MLDLLLFCVLESSQMVSADTSAGEKYSNPVAFVYVFNLIVGVGALSLPKGFLDAGLVIRRS